MAAMAVMADAEDGGDGGRGGAGRLPGGHRQPTARPRVNSTLGHTSSFTSADKPPHLQQKDFRRHTITFGKECITF